MAHAKLFQSIYTCVAPYFLLSKYIYLSTPTQHTMSYFPQLLAHWHSINTSQLSNLYLFSLFVYMCAFFVILKIFPAWKSAVETQLQSYGRDASPIHKVVFCSKHGNIGEHADSPVGLDHHWLGWTRSGYYWCCRMEFVASGTKAMCRMMT